MPVKRRQNLAEAGRGSYYREERLEEFLDSKDAFYGGNEKMKIMNSSSYGRVLPTVATK